MAKVIFHTNAGVDNVVSETNCGTRKLSIFSADDFNGPIEGRVIEGNHSEIPGNKVVTVKRRDDADSRFYTAEIYEVLRICGEKIYV